MDADKMWTKHDVMQFLQIGRSTFYKLLHEGMPSYIISGTYRFKKSEIEKWVNNQRVEPITSI